MQTEIRLLQGPPKFGWYKLWGLFEKGEESAIARAYREVEPPDVGVYLRAPSEIVRDLVTQKRIRCILNDEIPHCEEALIWTDDYDMVWHDDPEMRTWEDRTCKMAGKYLATVGEIYQEQSHFKDVFCRTPEGKESYGVWERSCVRCFGTLQGLVEVNGWEVLNLFLKNHERSDLMVGTTRAILERERDGIVC